MIIAYYSAPYTWNVFNYKATFITINSKKEITQFVMSLFYAVERLMFQNLCPSATDSIELK